MDVIYKTLCEVRLLHEYYLTNTDGKTIFDFAKPEERDDFLMQKLKDNAPSIDNDLEYEIPAYHEALYAGHRLRVLPSYSGFRIVVSVAKKELPGSTVAFEPIMPVTSPLTVLLLRKNSNLSTISNANLSHAIPASYYFTNGPFSASKTSPFLAAPAQEKDFLFPYEQGNLARDSFDNSVKAFYIDKAGAEQWADVAGEGYVTDADRMAVPPRFAYTFSSNASVTSAIFTLTDADGNEVKTIPFENITSKQVTLDFNDVMDEAMLQSEANAPKLYALKVATGNGFSVVHKLIFHSQQIPAHCWGIVSLLPKTSDASFSLLDDDGLLIARDIPGNENISHPVFEVRIKSRYTFWRYRNSGQKKIKPNNTLNPYLNYDSGGFMESLLPRNTSFLPTIFTNGVNSKFLPNPSSYELMKNESNRIYTEILVPKSELFDV